MKFIFAIGALVLTTAQSRKPSHVKTLVELNSEVNDWADLANPLVMAGDIQGYINTRDTIGYRLPRPTIHSDLFRQAGDVAGLLEEQESNKEKVVAGLKDFQKEEDSEAVQLNDDIDDEDKIQYEEDSVDEVHDYAPESQLMQINKLW